MSAGQDTERFRVRRGDCSPFVVIDYAGRSLDFAPMYVDSFRSRSAAEYAARQLNDGVARVDSHAVVGCKVVAA